MPDPSSNHQLIAALEGARADYAAYWQVVDEELSGLCRRRSSQHEFSDVYAKVTMVGRVYSAGISRSSRATDDRETAVARGIVAQADQLTERLAALSDARLDRATLAAIIGLHGRVTRDLRPYTGDTLLQSFASKYLHFHCSLVPIYDSRAAASIGKFVTWQRAYDIRKEIGQPAGALINYYNFATAFLTLAEQIDEATGAWPSIKEVDHLLWRA